MGIAASIIILRRSEYKNKIIFIKFSYRKHILFVDIKLCQINIKFRDIYMKIVVENMITE